MEERAGGRQGSCGKCQGAWVACQRLGETTEGGGKGGFTLLGLFLQANTVLVYIRLRGKPARLRVSPGLLILMAADATVCPHSQHVPWSCPQRGRAGPTHIDISETPVFFPHTVAEGITTQQNNEAANQEHSKETNATTKTHFIFFQNSHCKSKC